METAAGSASSSHSALSLVIHGFGAPAPLEHSLGFAAAPDIVTAITCSRFWAAAASSDVVWGGKCHELWSDKVYVPQRFRASGGDAKMSRLAAYWGSLGDAKRCAITAEELCAFEWSSRMKGWAGPDWTSSDPWWQGKPAATKRYSVDGWVESTARRGSGNSRWRFVPESSGRRGPKGSFLRHCAGRDYPTHFVGRWGRNWGWIIQNCWGFSASFPLPPRGEEPELEDEGQLCQSVTVDTCRDEAMRFNMGLPLPYEYDSEGGANDDGFVTVLVNGREQRLSTSLVAALVLSAHQQNEGQGEASSPSVDPDEESSHA